MKVFLLSVFLASGFAALADDVSCDVKASVHFSPEGGCTDAVCRELADAKALVETHRRGVDVKVILDKSQKTEKYSSATLLTNAGIPVLIDSKHAIAHNKIMIIDGETVITGSLNFTKAAEEKNAENLLVLRSKALADRYKKNWEIHETHSQ